MKKEKYKILQFLQYELIESYKDLLFEVLKQLKRCLSPFFYTITKLVRSTLSTRILFSTLRIWLSLTLLSLSIITLVIIRLGYGFALLRIKWFAYIWDEGILSIYSAVEFQHTWWMILVGVAALLWVLIRPSALPRKGGWRARFWALLVAYSLLYTLFILLSWQFQHYILSVRWFLLVGLFLLCHFLFILSIAILSNTTTRIPSLNDQYIRLTQKNILQEVDPKEVDPIDFIFKKSLYGHLVRQIAGELFDRSLLWIFRIFDRTDIQKMERTPTPDKEFKTARQQKIYQKTRYYFCRFFDAFSCAWLIDRLFGNPYYVAHFEMVLRHQMYQAKSKAWDTLQRYALHPALIEYAMPGIFVSPADSAVMAEEKAR